MKKNKTINILLVLLCFLLLGFVYVNTQLMGNFQESNQAELVEPANNNDEVSTEDVNP